jgi:hypothetical protein
MRSPIRLTGDPDVDAELWADRLSGPSADAAPAAEALAGLGTARSLQLLVDATRFPDFHEASRRTRSHRIRSRPLRRSGSGSSFAIRASTSPRGRDARSRE